MDSMLWMVQVRMLTSRAASYNCNVRGLRLRRFGCCIQVTPFSSRILLVNVPDDVDVDEPMIYVVLGIEREQKPPFTE